MTSSVRNLLNKRFFRSSESQIKRITDIDVLETELKPINLFLSGCSIHRIYYYVFLHHYQSVSQHPYCPYFLIRQNVKPLKVSPQIDFVGIA